MALTASARQTHPLRCASDKKEARPSAVEALEASKAQYVKSVSVLSRRQSPVLRASIPQSHAGVQDQKVALRNSSLPTFSSRLSLPEKSISSVYGPRVVSKRSQYTTQSYFPQELTDPEVTAKSSLVTVGSELLSVQSLQTSACDVTDASLPVCLLRPQPTRHQSGSSAGSANTELPKSWCSPSRDSNLSGSRARSTSLLNLFESSLNSPNTEVSLKRSSSTRNLPSDKNVTLVDIDVDNSFNTRVKTNNLDTESPPEPPPRRRKSSQIVTTNTRSSSGTPPDLPHRPQRKFARVSACSEPSHRQVAAALNEGFSLVTPLRLSLPVTPSVEENNNQSPSTGHNANEATSAAKPINNIDNKAPQKKDSDVEDRGLPVTKKKLLICSRQSPDKDVAQLEQLFTPDVAAHSVQLSVARVNHPVQLLTVDAVHPLQSPSASVADSVQSSTTDAAPPAQSVAVNAVHPVQSFTTNGADSGQLLAEDATCPVRTLAAGCAHAVPSSTAEACTSPVQTTTTTQPGGFFPRDSCQATSAFLKKREQSLKMQDEIIIPGSSGSAFSTSTLDTGRVQRSKSDLGQRGSRSSVGSSELDRFFSCMGLERTVLQTAQAQHWQALNTTSDASCSSLDFCADSRSSVSVSSAQLRHSPMLLDRASPDVEALVRQNAAANPGDTYLTRSNLTLTYRHEPGRVETNARVIKWLCGMRRANGKPSKNTAARES